MDNFILCGMQFGDEGKGTFVDYLAHEKDIDCIVRYNGGSQASHTVVTPSRKLHKFSQLGSGMFLPECETYITENMVINLENLFREVLAFSNESGISIPNIMSRIHIHENCFMVTPYHKLINKLREFSKGKGRRGTVGTGVSEVRYLLNLPKMLPYEPPLGLKFKDIFDFYHMRGILQSLQEHVTEFYQKNKEVIWKNVPDDMKSDLQSEIGFLLERQSFLTIASNFRDTSRNELLKKCLYSAYELSFRKSCKSAIFEGSQGLLIDGTYGIKPNTTFLDTTNHFALDISYYKDKVSKIGIAKAFTSRHGLGVFPTESVEVSDKICDENQEATFWNGKIRFGWFDAVLFRYAQKINQVDEVYLSSLDKLDDFSCIKICSSYLYQGKIDKIFTQLFDYYISLSGRVIVTDIKYNGEELSEYLEKCTPQYRSFEGWKTDLSHASKQEDLPDKCIAYIEHLEKMIGVPITLVSVGPTRENKIKLHKRMWSNGTLEGN